MSIDFASAMVSGEIKFHGFGVSRKMHQPDYQCKEVDFIAQRIRRLLKALFCVNADPKKHSLPFGPAPVELIDLKSIKRHKIDVANESYGTRIS